MLSAESIVKYMAIAGPDASIQLAQTRHRITLVETWQIPSGARVLEIASGQGDTTAVLAEAGGPGGQVTAVDIASPTYGAPITLGDAMAHLLKSPVGDRIDAHFEFDLLDPANSFPEDAFDYIVLAHGAWYFESLEQLSQVLTRVKPWGKTLCFAEWDLTPRSTDQMAHLLAVLIQGQIETAKPISESNVRSPFSRNRLLRLLDEIGWDVASDETVETSGLQDAAWEIDACLNHALPEIGSLGIPSRLRELISSQADTLRALTETPGFRATPLDVYALTASSGR